MGPALRRSFLTGCLRVAQSDPDAKPIYEVHNVAELQVRHSPVLANCSPYRRRLAPPPPPPPTLSPPSPLPNHPLPSTPPLFVIFSDPVPVVTTHPTPTNSGGLRWTKSPVLSSCPHPFRGMVHPLTAMLPPDQQVDTSLSGTQWGTGGMATKLTAASLATAAGCKMAISHAAHVERILRIVNGEKIGTVFYPVPNALKGRRRWILSVPVKVLRFPVGWPGCRQLDLLTIQGGLPATGGSNRGCLLVAGDSLSG